MLMVGLGWVVVKTFGFGDFDLKICRMESLKMRSLRSMAKIGGTVICVSGAMCMALLRGPKLLNSSLGFGMKSSIFSVESGSPHAWLLGSLCVFGSCCCWSIWLILQVYLSNRTNSSLVDIILF